MDEKWYKKLLIKSINSDYGGMSIYNKKELLYYITKIIDIV